MTAGQRWRRRRNIAIYAAYRSGPPLSERFLADVFDLARSQVSTIVRSLRAAETAETGRGDLDASSAAFGDWLARKLRETARPPH